MDDLERGVALLLRQAVEGEEPSPALRRRTEQRVLGGPARRRLPVRPLLVAAACAAVVGAVVLVRSPDGGRPATEVASGGQVTTTLVVSTTVAAQGVAVLAANGTTTPGLATRLAEQLGVIGYKPVGAVDALTPVPSTAIYFLPEFASPARKLAQDLGIGADAVRPMPQVPPVAGLNGAGIVVVIGANLYPAAQSRPTTEQPRPPAPWAGPRLAPEEAPVVVEQWSRAPNRSECPALSFSALGEGEGGVPRAADFGQGWGVAWDKPGTPGQLADGTHSPAAGRSTFGVAGTGGLARPSVSDGWPFQASWSDGSQAGYGYEGARYQVEPNPLGTTKWLAYLRLQGHSCLYNVWSNLGQGHLEYLLEHLRFVETGG